MDYMKYGKTEIGDGSVIQPNVILGAPSTAMEHLGKDNLPGAKIGKECFIRSGTVIYSNAKIGDKFKTGHNVLIRENTLIGDNVLVGTNAIIENDCKIGSNVSIQSNAYIPTNTVIGDNVFVGPNACLTNDKYPVRIKNDLVGPMISKGVTIGANSIILPGIKVGEGAMIAAGSVVTKDVSPWKLSIGSPARDHDMPNKLKVMNDI